MEHRRGQPLRGLLQLRQHTGWQAVGALAITPDVALRGTVSSGFRAPTPAQLNTTSTTQGLDTRTLQIFTSGRLSPNDPLAQLLGAKPLKPEESRTASLGLTWRTDLGLSGSVDVYQIKLTDRFSQSASFAIPAGTPNPLGYTSVNYFTNDFDTTTTGVDVVGNYLRDLGAGRMTLTLAYNYNRTHVDNGSTSVATNEPSACCSKTGCPSTRAV